MSELEKRHFADLTFSEVSRALRALSSAYVERRGALAEGAVFSGAGKRAAFALFYAPLHFLLVRHIAAQLLGEHKPGVVVDLGCGTGAAGAAISGAQVLGIDKSSWALAEAVQTYRAFGLESKTHRGDATTVALPKRGAFVVAAFTMNELPDRACEPLMDRLLTYARIEGKGLLIVEPLARGVARWWDRWRDQFEGAGGRADEWRFPARLPEIVAKLDRAAGLRHDEITGRSLFLGR